MDCGGPHHQIYNGPAKDDNDAENWSLKNLMALCFDFAGEMTALQHVGHKLGVPVLIIPKFHAKVAGEGI
jgi:hypothetical protein